MEPFHLPSRADMAEDDVERQSEKLAPAKRSVHVVFYIAYVIIRVVVAEIEMDIHPHHLHHLHPHPYVFILPIHSDLC